VRHLIDRRRKSISLWRLLGEMEKIASNLTREWYLSMHDENIKIFADKGFSELAGEGTKHITKRSIRFKKEILKQAVFKTEEYSNTYIAWEKEQTWLPPEENHDIW